MRSLIENPVAMPQAACMKGVLVLTLASLFFALTTHGEVAAPREVLPGIFMRSEPRPNPPPRRMLPLLVADGRKPGVAVGMSDDELAADVLGVSVAP